MEQSQAVTSAAGGQSDSTVGLGINGRELLENSVLTLTNSAIWAEVSADGVLTRFDNAACRQLAAEFDPASPIDQNKAIARLCVALLERAAQEVDHIYRAGGGTQGDTIRALVMPNAELTGASGAVAAKRPVE